MNIVVIGAQWGDEGKGKIVDYLADDASVVTRFSGGANAGHTIVNGGVTYKLHLVPSGIVYPGKTVILGTGMVIDVESLFAELKTLEEQGIAWKGRVLISERAHLVFPTYKAMDLEMEKKRRNPIGTTGRGIGIAYAQKADRDGVRCCDLFNPDVYKTLKDEEKAFIEPYMSRIKEMIVDPVSYMAERKDANKLFEGAQGALLDIDTGTYPYVSSGYSIASGACAGGGIGALDIDAVYGVFKAYNTRVGNGPFPTEFDHNAEGELEQAHVYLAFPDIVLARISQQALGARDVCPAHAECRNDAVAGSIAEELRRSSHLVVTESRKFAFRTFEVRKRYRIALLEPAQLAEHFRFRTAVIQIFGSSPHIAGSAFQAQFKNA